jgi:outer membrane protein assembly factor BamA
VRDQLIGSSAALANLEVRVPVIKELQIGFLGNFPPVDAVAFLDGGLAWDNQVCLGALDPTRNNECAEPYNVNVVWDRRPGQDPFLWREPLFSWGLGLRINVFYTILRLDYAFPLNRPDHGGVFSVSFGPSF